ncbi:hypothetical protein PZB74_06170 [Porifericola rhodea]|uniref:hypothetical protein n=1 Tax=Porifericola rhodea TaxID=930972 RepID=UPI002665F47A|nr:hypothetical protein [Porifericola rhodea]WKN32928.1 hypothetical protein PZB74_06170 [Porifericola rhodea]
MSDDELKDKILAYVINRHTEINTSKTSKGVGGLPTYDEIRKSFKGEQNNFYNHFSIVSQEWLDIKKNEDGEKVYREKAGARFFLYVEEGYQGRKKKTIMAGQVAEAAISSSWAAWGSALAAITLLFTTFWNTAKDDEKTTPFILRTQELMQAREKQILELQNEVMLLRAKVEALESVAHDSSVVSSKAKTHK